MTEGWIKVEGFPHTAGGHCESTTLRDQLSHLGFSYSEPMIFGLDATMGFSFWGLEGGFPLGGKQSSFNENSLACRLLGIIPEKKLFNRSREAWQDAKSLLDQNLPLILQVDMGYLPYFMTPGEEPFHFGGHLVSLIGYHKERSLTLLCDNNFEEPVEVPLENLKKARSSREGTKFLWPHNIRYTLTRRPDGKRPPLGAGAKLAIQEVVKNMLAPSISQNGIQGLKRFVSSIGEWRTSFADKMEQGFFYLKNVYGYIEEYGTGGALFRKMYCDFLQELVELPELQEGSHAWSGEDIQLLKSSLPSLRQSAAVWSEFALNIKEGIESEGKTLIAALDCDKLQHLGEEILRFEKSFWHSLKALKL